jgi:2-isopropylmalate synthase
MAREALIHDWNQDDLPSYNTDVQLDDETLRDGLQSPSVTQPTIGQKLEILHLMNDLGIHIADIGLPGAGQRVAEDVERLAREIVDCRLSIQAGCAARTVLADIKPVVDISYKVGIPIEVHTFIGSSPIRQYVEGWDLDLMLRHTRDAIRFAVSNGCPVMYVTEDTTRASRDTIKALFSEAIECGATRMCLCDTVGHATPNGVRSLIRFVREEVIGPDSRIKIDWHGHSDRGLAMANAFAAIEAGVDRVHGTGLGIGERAGNVPMDQLLVNLKLLGIITHDLRKLKAYCDAVARTCGCTIPANYPVVGMDAFRTGTGVHAAAIIKSVAKEDDHWLRDEVYSGVRAGDFGFRQIIEIGPMSGKSNVSYWLEERGLDAPTRLVDRVFERAKNATRVMRDDEIYRIIVEEFMKNTRAPGPADLQS